MTDNHKILILFAHLEFRRSRINRALLEAVADLDGVIVDDLLESHPDFYFDVDFEQARLREADVLVLQYPIYWYGPPAILKHWMDSVLTRGFAFGPGGDSLHGKRLLVACSTGAPEGAYAADGLHGASFADFLRPLSQSARFCGMTWLEPHVLYAGNRKDDDVVAAHARAYRERLTSIAADGVALRNADGAI